MAIRTIQNSKITKILNTRVRNRPFLRFVSFLIAIGLLFFLYSKGVIAPLFVNGEPVKLSEILESYNNGGPGNLLDRLVSEKLVEIEARRRNIVVRKEEIDAEMLKFEKDAIENGRTLVQLLEENDQTLAQFEKDTKVRLTIYKILGSGVTLDEDEVDRIIEENPWLYKNDEELEAVREEIRDLLIERRLQDSYDSWILDAKAESDVRYFVKF